MKYRIINANLAHLDDFELAVTMALVDGWKLAGNVFTFPGHGTTYVAQALTLDTEAE